jgi:V-type H+-transporting ATPase subunit a
MTELRDCSHYDGLIVRPGEYPYPFGVDPVWRGTKTELPYLNSLKMKMSIIIGVIHMNLGILMSFYNNNYFGDALSTLCEFVPQVIFLNSLFGYLSILICWKWISGMTTDLYNVLIYMFLKPGLAIQPTDAGYAYPGQSSIQVILLLCAFIAVPWMLLPKPLILKARAEAAKKTTGSSSAYSRMEDSEQGACTSASHHGGGGHGGGHGDHDGEFDFGEAMVHQMIHSIEFILGAVSNTASYLRLWALSLAHSQLSAVFYDRVLMAGVQADSPAALFIAFFVWACATLGVLMVMESLSAFLHALRLHWVEFQNKFYKGTGWAFSPFSFASQSSLEEASH